MADEIEEQTACYPGSTLTAADVIELAENYFIAAQHMLEAKWVNRPKFSAPYRLVAIHAIELYLNAYLLAAGVGASTIRGMQHNLARRTDLVNQANQVIGQKTADHLICISQNREYLVSRYDAPETNSVSQTNRIQSTLINVRKIATAKVAAKLAEKFPEPA